ENLSFTRAAEVMFMTQSGVSHQIARLESAIGVQLFNRAARTVSLTRAGETLLHQARKLLVAMDSAIAAVRQASDPDRGTLRARAELRDWIELGSIEAIKELVKLGLGVSVAGQWTTRTEVAEGSLAWLPLPGATLRRSWCIAHASGRTLALAEQSFIGLCQSA